MRSNRGRAAAILALSMWGIMIMNDQPAAGGGEVGASKDFDEKWNFNQPDSTEAVFRALLPAARAGGDPDYLAQLLTQIARTEGLQGKFDAAHATLDEVETMLSDTLEVAAIRYLLERGRVYNSSQQPEQARPLFLAAWDRARGIGADFYAVDAAHMLGIIEPPAEALAWNRKAMEMAEASASQRARRWLGALYNNMGWTYHDQGDYATALDLFTKGLAWRQEQKQPAETRIAKWAVARALRSLARVDEALAMQQELHQEFERLGEPDGYVYEEIGECLLLLGHQDRAAPYFARAHEILSRDRWLAENEAARLARLKELGAAGGSGDR